VGGASERYSIRPDLMVLGKALANGFPLAAVGGTRDVMAAATRTWISSTLATEFVSLAAAQATLQVMAGRNVPAHLEKIGSRLLDGLQRLHRDHPDLVSGVGGIPQMCFLLYADDMVSRTVTAACAHSGLLFKRSAYNFVSLAHEPATIDRTLALLGEALSTVAKPA
jgi:glutamate-1-semialdehyde 2,1-aminomutase